MSKIIIGIHGLGNKPPEELLRKWWKKAIREGLKAIGQPRLFFKFELVYWAHFFHPEPLNPKEKDKKHKLYLRESYAPAGEFTTQRTSKWKRKVLDYIERQLDRILLNKDKSISFPAITDFILHHYFRDLEEYYTSTCVEPHASPCPAKAVIRRQLTRALEKHRGKDILLIAHSMGSIIAYDVLLRLPPEVKIDTFVTIGSPLGLPVIMGKIMEELGSHAPEDRILRTPESILREWHNFSDLQDKVAMNYNLGDDYEENSRYIRAADHVVHNNYEIHGARNPHKSYGYLRAPELAKVIHEFLNRGKSKGVVFLADKINKSLSRIFW